MSKYDLWAKLEGISPVLLMVSSKSIEQFLNYQIDKVDKVEIFRGLGKFIPESMGNRRTTELTKQRRKNLTTWMSLNSSSKYIPGMLNCWDRILEDMHNENETDILHQMNILTFTIFTEVLFGDDVNELVTRLHPYENADGSIEEIPIREMLIRLSKWYLENYYNPLTVMLPFLNEYRIVNPYKRDHKNMLKFKEAVRELIKESKDTNSVGYKLAKFDAISEQEGLDDVCGSMVAGAETTAHSLVSCLYFLNKHPKILKKLRDELEENCFVKGEDLKSKFTIDNIQNLTYLTWVIKETLRVDSVVSDTFDYEALEDISICNVPISKGTRLKIDIHSAHFDSKKWLDPYSYEPDRHDIESEFYQKSRDEGRTPDVYWRRAFSHGARSCPGQSFANLEMRIVIAYMVLNMNFQFEKKDLEHENIGFGMGSHFVPKIKVNKIA